MDTVFPNVLDIVHDLDSSEKVDTGAANAAPPVPTYHQWLLLPRGGGGVEEGCVGTVSDGISDTIASKQTDKLFLFLLEHDPDNVA